VRPIENAVRRTRLDAQHAADRTFVGGGSSHCGFGKRRTRTVQRHEQKLDPVQEPDVRNYTKRTLTVESLELPRPLGISGFVALCAPDNARRVEHVRL
jgi:hypothetical protein